jgi:cytochrome b561
MPSLRNSQHGFGLITKTLHWVIALLIATLIALGWYMVDLTYYDRWYNASLAWHKVLGMGVLVLGVVFVGWHLISRSPEYPATVPQWQRTAAAAAHYLLFAMMLLIPVTVGLRSLRYFR